MVELKVRKFGNSLGVVLPRKVIHRLQTGDGKRLFLMRRRWVITGSRLRSSIREEDEKSGGDRDSLSQHSWLPS